MKITKLEKTQAKGSRLRPRDQKLVVDVFVVVAVVAVVVVHAGSKRQEPAATGTDSQEQTGKKLVNDTRKVSKTDNA